MKFYFPLHLNGDNRGCEAIAKGTAVILDEKKENLIGLCSNITLDKRLGVDKYITMIPSIQKTNINKIDIALHKLLHHDLYNKTYKEYQINYKSFLNRITTNDIMVSTGGDMMCYNDNQVIYTTDEVYKRGIKSILFGCSMGKENLTPRKLEILKKFKILYARESLTANFFKSMGFNNVICYPDPAFILEPQTVKLPIYLNNNEIIGINISKMVIEGNTSASSFVEEFKLLIEYILTNTNFQILLIPHVLWKNQDDRIQSKQIYELYKDTDRIHVLDTEQYNYCEIRFIISKCTLFIGARTHSIISAYSMCIPALALGYSIKSRGIAQDLGLNERLVVDCVNYRANELMSSFIYLMNNKNEIRAHLQSIMPEYKERLRTLKNDIIKLLY